MKLLLLTSHSIAEYDDTQMFARMGVDVFTIGAYTDPAAPVDNIRPALPDVHAHPYLADLCREQRERHAGEDEGRVIDWAKADLHPDLIDWADVIVIHHFPEIWLDEQWPRIRHKRVIWRTCGQSYPGLETRMLRRAADGLVIVRYSPAEARAFLRMGTFAGQDALIRFGKDPADWYGWTGEDRVVGNVTQKLTERGDFCGYPFWLATTSALPTRPSGLGSDVMPNGTGGLTYDEMRDYLRGIRAYLYLGTQPASYTLALIEAMMTGVPIVSIGPKWMGAPDLFEGHELAGLWSDDPNLARAKLEALLTDDAFAEYHSDLMRERALALFDIHHVMAEWAELLGIRVAVAA